MEEKIVSENLSKNSNHHSDRRNYECDESVNSIISHGTPTKSPRRDTKTTPKKSTPVKKIIKRLFVCSSSKKKPKESSVLSTSSSEGYQGYPLDGHCSTSSSPTNLKYPLPHSESGTVAETATTVSSSRTIPSNLSNLTEDSTPQSPPCRSKVARMKDPTAIPLPDSPIGESHKSQALMHEILPSSPDNMDEFFLPEESSSSGSEGPSPISTPTHHNAMRSPGISIPTPQTRPSLGLEEREKAMSFPHPLRTISESPKTNAQYSVNQSIDEDAFLPDDFKNNIRTYTWEEVQRYVRDAEAQLKDHLEDRHQHAMEELQEEAEKSLHEHGSQWKTDSEQEFLRMSNSLRDEKAKTQQKHMELINKVTEMAEMKDQLDNFQLEREEYESYIASLEAQLQDTPKSGSNKAKDLQRQEMDQEFRELQEQMKALRAEEQDADIESVKRQHQQELQELLEKNAAAEERAEKLQRQLTSLERKLPASPARSMGEQEQEELHQEELRNLQASKEEANREVLALQDQLDILLGDQMPSDSTEDIILLKSEKAAAERKLAEMQEAIDLRTEEKLAAQSSLREARTEIKSLKAELETLSLDNSSRLDMSVSSDASREELFIARAEVETLRVLRQEDETKRQAQMQAIIGERDALKSQLRKIKHKYQIELSSPRRKGRESTVSIHAMTVEVEPSPRNGASLSDSAENASEERLKIMGQNFAKLQQEKKELELELQKAKESRETETGAATQLEALREELEKKDRDHEAEKRNLRADLSVAEIAELTAEVQELQQRHQQELKELKQQVAADIEKAIQIERESSGKSRLRFEEEKQQLEAKHQEEVSKLESKIQELRDEHKEEIELVKTKSKEEAELELNILQNELKKLRIEFEGEKIEIIKTSAKEQDDLMSKLDEIRERNRAEVEVVRTELRAKTEAEIKSLQEMLEEANKENEMLGQVQKERDECILKIQSLQQELSESKSNGARVSEQHIQELKSKFEEDLEHAREASQLEISSLRQTLDVSAGEKKKLLARLQVLSEKLDEADEAHKQQLEIVKKESQEAMDKELESLEETIKTMEMGDTEATRKAKELKEENDALRIETDLQVKKLREDHTKEIDEMLAQLDLVEAEHNEKFREKERQVHEKDAVISALSSQLAEAQSRLGTVAESQKSMQKELEGLTEELKQSRADTAAKNEDINRLLAEHRQAMEDQAILREQACEDAKEEMIKLAEVQFEQRNEHYKKLKHEFDNAASKIVALEVELKAVKTEAAEARKRQEAIEIDLADEVAQAKAEAAASDLNAARKNKQYRMELEESKALETELRRQLDEAKTTSQSLQSAFASIVSEKEALSKENQDLTAVCEELMAEIEGRPGK